MGHARAPIQRLNPNQAIALLPYGIVSYRRGRKGNITSVRTTEGGWRTVEQWAQDRQWAELRKEWLKRAVDSGYRLNERIFSMEVEVGPVSVPVGPGLVLYAVARGLAELNAAKEDAGKSAAAAKEHERAMEAYTAFADASGAAGQLAVTGAYVGAGLEPPTVTPNIPPPPTLWSREAARLAQSATRHLIEALKWFAALFLPFGALLLIWQVGTDFFSGAQRLISLANAIPIIGPLVPGLPGAPDVSVSV